MCSPIATPEPGKALSLARQRRQDLVLFTGFEVAHVAVEHHTQRVAVDQERALLRAMHGKPGVQAAQRLDDAAIKTTHQGQHPADRQAARNAPRHRLRRQVLRHGPVPG